MVARIPEGQLATYGQIAELIGAWGCARQVGWALRRLPLPSDLPWHRVVNAKGRISLSLAREGSDWIQAELLRGEGIAVDGEGQLPLSRHRWRGPLPFESIGPCALANGSVPERGWRKKAPSDDIAIRVNAGVDDKSKRRWRIHAQARTNTNEEKPVGNEPNQRGKAC
jgi:methylated-DNA-protein-cysteine methyltransferase-like protein